MYVKYLSLIIFCLSSILLCAQQDFSVLNPVSNNKYKKVLKRAKEQDKMILFVCHTAQSTNSSIFLAEGEQVAQMADRIITAVVDWNVDTRNKIWQRVEIKSNPYYVFMHYDDVILSTRNAINSEEEMIKFYGEALTRAKKYESLNKQIKENQSTIAYKQLSSFYLANNEKSKAKSTIEDWIQQHEPLRKEEDLEFLAGAHQNCLCSNRMDMVMGQYENEMKRIIGKEAYLNIRQAFILTNLREVGLMEPFYVWEAFDDNLGIHADSLYRLFAIQYFKNILPDQQVMLDEIYNFLYYYPRAPWEIQKELFEAAVKSTKDQEDWTLLLDLIEYQILEDSTYQKRDIKSVILYKMGKKDRAIELMNKVEGEAILIDPDFTPLLFQYMDAK